ncbi:transglutaminase domain-containing protein [Sphaerospermopsis aphanizomenoides BCCUSP55]|uniref:transglutaminase-like domain-containing protein n=1 Tax=Sphaerospermopsis aphanizomenoides TaxID=459663 RepID=UPI0019076EDC|nr:transglutaminase-like domain-containing protein [Sphaerospermopsis aphanizomenoides]MBK1986726.1 transglutaminase domain-containing protein [Sphaerospermopsis aphanizomenoides BCCUSP55]
MKTPPLLLGVALIFWGWQTGIWIFAIPIAIILECSRLVQSRWDFSTDEIKRIANICLVILVALTIYLFISSRSFYVVYTLFQWLPIVFSPLIAAHIYAVNDNINLTTLFLIFNDEKTGEQSNQFRVNLTYPYFALCILAASNANTENISFYIGMFALSAMALWFVRSPRFSPIIWLCLFLTAGSIGFIGQIGLHQLHLKVEDQIVSWFSDAIGQEINAFKKQTSMGEIGVLKQSNDIVFRVASQTKSNFPILLREATYNKYQSALWIALNPAFTPVKPDANNTTWRLGNQTANSSTLTIYGTLNNGKGVLRLADGTLEINDLPVSEMEKNKYGTVKVSGKINDIAYKIKFNNQVSFDSPPTEDDLQIPKSEASAINEIVQQLEIEGKTPQQILQTVDTFLLKNYRYSLQLTGKDNASTPLSTFLLTTRAGHCEYFASATTLILRALGIPTRYSVGYSVHEFSNLEKQYIVRSRHAHAWTMVYIDGKWQAFDTTPADWTSIENAGVSKLSMISDLWSFWGFQLSSWLRDIRSSGFFKYIWWLLLPLFLLMIAKSAPQKKVKRVFKQEILSTQTHKIEIEISKDSEFYLIENTLNELGFARQPSESLKNWIERLKKEIPTSDLIEDLSSLIELHYRYRFDPQGIQETERAKLKSAVQSWLAKYST